jgi:hypothetical protein
MRSIICAEGDAHALEFVDPEVWLLRPDQRLANPVQHLEPASAAVPAAAKQQNNENNDDEKRGVIHCDP